MNKQVKVARSELGRAIGRAGSDSPIDDLAEDDGMDTFMNLKPRERKDASKRSRKSQKSLQTKQKLDETTSRVIHADRRTVDERQD